MTLKNKKILLIRLSALGDVIFNIPLANLLKKNGARLHWLVSEKGYDIVKNNPCCDKVILAPVEKWKKEKNKFKNIKEYFEIIKSLRNENYDIALDTQLILKSLIWTRFCGAKRRIVAKSAREGAIFGGNEVIEPLFNDFKTHAIYNYFKFASYLGINIDEIIVTLPKPTSETINKVDYLLNGINKPILTLAPMTTWFNKHWNKNNWRELISKIDKNKYKVVCVGTKKDNSYINDIIQDDVLNLAGKTNLLELIEVFRRTNVLISLDSGSTHLAWAAKCNKIISIFCCTPKERYAPIGKNHIALSAKLPCQPCHKKHCPNKTNACTNYPRVDEVLEALEKSENVI